MIDLTPRLRELYGEKKRKLGRYNASEIWAIDKGYLKPENYLKKEILDFKSIFRMWQGTWKHKQVEELLEGWKLERKTEYAHENWTLVGKADGLKDNQVLEIKTSTTLFDKAKSWHEYQVKLYCSLFLKEEGIICQPVIKGNSLILKIIGTVKRDDKWFLRVIEKIDKFHNQVKK